MTAKPKKKIIDNIREVESEPILLSKIKFDPNNPNHMSDRQFAGLEKALQTIGYAVEVWVNKQKDGTYLMINGEHRAKALKKHGFKTIQAKVFNVPYSQVRVYRQIGNNLHGNPIKKKDDSELKAVFESNNLDSLADMLGKKKEGLERILENRYGMKFEKEEGELPETPTETTVKLGDVYQLGPHFVLCGDATNQETVKKFLTGVTPRLVFTDPPYKFDTHNYLDHFFDTYEDIEILVMNGDHSTVEMLQFYATWFVGFLVNIFLHEPTNYLSNQPIIAHRLITHYRKGKSNFQNLRDGYHTVNEFYLLKSGLHKHEKVIEMPKRHLIHYTNPGEVVVDLFGGSGTFLMACENIGRVCFTIELDPKNVDVILKRYENYTKIKPKKII